MNTSLKVFTKNLGRYIDTYSKKSIVLIALSFLVFGGLFAPQFTYAQADAQCVVTADCSTGSSCVDGQCVADTFGLAEIGQNTNLSSQDIRLTIGKIIQVALGLVGVIMVVLIMYAGFTIMTAAGNADKVTDGKKILTNATIGLAIIMASMGIVQFIFYMLTASPGTGGDNQGDNPNGSGPNSISSFISSGSLGSIVKDTYPRPGDTDIKRNTKIAITFAQSINPASFIENTNNTCWNEAGNGPSTICTQDNNGNIIDPYYGDCLVKDTLDFSKDCDQLKTSSIQIYQRADKDKDPLPVSGAMVLAIYKSKDEAEVFSFKPTALLGSDKEDTWYRVDLTNNIIKKDGTGAFSNILGAKYSWEFQTGVTTDVSPPEVVSIIPNPESNMARNIILQVSFNEAIDPAVAQGLVGPDSSFNHIIFKNSQITGQWKITNGYKTLEFISDQVCGQNSCGENMYCLPVPDCTENDTACIQKEEVLIRSGELVQTNQQTFDAKPFSGVVDMAGNALDGNKNGKPEGRPPITSVKVISDNEKGDKTDNVWYTLGIQNTIDLSIPYIESVVPDIDAQGISGSLPVEIIFNSSLQYSTLFDGLKVEEYPNVKDDKGQDIFFWNQLTVSNVSDVLDANKASKTKAMISHREFGPDGKDLFYFVSVSSTVKGANGNCLYPGRGPSTAKKSCIYVKGKDDNCLPPDGYSKIDASLNDTGCAISDNGFDTTQPDIAACIGALKKDVDVLLNNTSE